MRASGMITQEHAPSSSVVLPTPVVTEPRRKYRHSRRLAIGSIFLLPFLAASIYIGVYFLMYRLLPWQKSEGMETLILNAAQVSSTPVQLQHGHMEEGMITSTLLPGTHPFYVYLPSSYGSGSGRYPVLYLLHGAPGKYTDWYLAAGIDRTLDALMSTGRLRPMIVVLPDGNGGPLSDTEWADSAKARAEDYMVQDVVPYIDMHYRTLSSADQRAIGGLSTGAFGAVNISLHHPDLFGFAIGFSGNYLAGRTWTHQVIWTDTTAKQYNSPMIFAVHAPNVTSLHIYLGASPSDRFDDCYHQTLQFAAVLTQIGVPHRADYFAGGHTWTYWKTHIVDALEYLQATMPME